MMKTREQQKANYRKWYQKQLRENLVKFRADQKLKRQMRKAIYDEYRATHRAAQKEWAAKHYKKNRERIRAKSNEYWLKNRERINSKQSKYRAANPEKVKAGQKASIIKNPEVMKASQAKYRARRRGAMIGNTKLIIEWEKRWRRKKFARCHWCLKRFSSKLCHSDHIIPLSRGGPHSIENMAISCQPCNNSKCAKMPDEWNKKLDQPILL